MKTKTKPTQPPLIRVPRQPFANPAIARSLKHWREQIVKPNVRMSDGGAERTPNAK